MSGGRFDHRQFIIQDIAETIDEKIQEIARPRPPQHLEKWVSCKKQMGEGCYTSDSRMWDAFRGCRSLEEAREEIKYHFHVDERDGRFYDQFDKWTDRDGVEHPCEYILSYHEDMYYDEGYEDTHYYGEDFRQETIEEFKRGRDLLRRAYIYAQRIDWLLSGDDGEDTFHERLREDLSQLEKDGDLRNVY